MKNFFWMVGGVCAAAVGLLVWNPYKKRPVEDLAQSLPSVWQNDQAPEA